MLDYMYAAFPVDSATKNENDYRKVFTECKYSEWLLMKNPNRNNIKKMLFSENLKDFNLNNYKTQ